MQGSVTKRGRDQGDSGQQPQPKRSMSRRRAILACQECRVRKRKCDSKIPSCGGCMKRMSVCVYSAEVEAREWQYSVIESLRERLEELERAAEPPSTKDDRQDQRDDCAMIGDVVPENRGNGTTPIEEFMERDKSDPIQRLQCNESLDDALAARQVFALQDNFDAEVAIPVNPYEISPQMELQGECLSHCIEPSFERFMTPIDHAIDRNGGSSPSIPALVGRQQVSLSPMESSVPNCETDDCTCDRSLDAMRCQLPLRRLADKLVAIFFHRYNRMLPIIHQKTFTKQYERLWESKTSTGPGSQVSCTCTGFCKQKSRGKLFPAMVNAVFALGSLFMSRFLEQNIAQAEEFFERAEDFKLFDALNNEVGIELVQLGLLISFYLQSTERFSKCFSVAGLTIRMAQNMGLHFDIGVASRRGLISRSTTKPEIEMRSRVWHACVLLDTETSMAFRQPRMIPSDGTHVKLPDSISDDRLGDDIDKPDTWSSEPGLMEYYIRTVELYGILGKALDRLETKVMISSTAWSQVQGILELDAQIMDWRDSLPDSLKYDPSSDNTVQLDLDVLDIKALARRLYCRFIHTRQLILRPALELLFEKQQRNLSPPMPPGEPVEWRLHESMLHNIAARCVLYASNLIDFLTKHIKMHNFDCWWYNISYLYTSGSTILMGQFCEFQDVVISSEALSTSWTLCLQYLARYQQMSSIARKSSQLLLRSARSLTLHEICGTSNSSQTSPQECKITAPANAQSDKLIHAWTDQNVEIATGSNISQSKSTMITQGDFFQDLGQDESRLPMTSDEFWDNEALGYPPWAFMPALSQLEAFPLDVDISDVMY